MMDIYPAIGGTVGSVAVVLWIARSLNARMNGVEKNTVNEKLCNERYDHLRDDIREIKECLKEIKTYLMNK